MAHFVFFSLSHQNKVNIVCGPEPISQTAISFMLVAPQATNIQVLLWENIFSMHARALKKPNFTKTLQNTFQGLYMLFQGC